MGGGGGGRGREEEGSVYIATKITGPDSPRGGGTQYMY